MSEKRQREFQLKVDAAIDAIKEYRDGRMYSNDWFERGLDHQIRNAVEEMLAFGLPRPFANSGD